MFFKTLKNKMRCLFCRKYCDIRYRIGECRYYSGYGYRSFDCPKDIKKLVPTSGMTVKEIREQMKKAHENNKS